MDTTANPTPQDNSGPDRPGAYSAGQTSEQHSAPDRRHADTHQRPDNPAPVSGLAELYEEIEQAKRDATFLTGFRLVMFGVLLVFAAFALVDMAGRATDPRPAGPGTASRTALTVAASVRLASVSTPLPATGAGRAAVSAASERPATATTAPTGRAVVVLPATAHGNDRDLDDLDQCDDRARDWTDLTPTSDRRDRNGRPWVVHAGPIDVEINLDVAARRACDNRRDRANARPSSDRDCDPRDRDTDRDNRGDCICVDLDPDNDRDRDGDRRGDRASWRDDRPAHPTNYRPYPRHGDTSGPEVCRAYRPGVHPDVPDGGVVCTREDRTPR